MGGIDVHEVFSIHLQSTQSEYCVGISLFYAGVNCPVVRGISAYLEC